MVKGTAEKHRRRLPCGYESQISPTYLDPTSTIDLSALYGFQVVGVHEHALLKRSTEKY